MDKHRRLAAYLSANPSAIGKVIDYNPSTDRLYHFDLTADNNDLLPAVFENTAMFSAWIDQSLNKSQCSYGIGGYMEIRTIYSRSTHFYTADEPRRLHLGMDIWAKAGTPVYSPLEGKVHSFNNNDHFGDYGPTIILEHNLNGLVLYSLYGHLNLESLQGLKAGAHMEVNRQIANFGSSNENGNWPPHLHFQLMFDMEGKAGDYPGVCRYSEKNIYLKNIPDPQLILKFSNAIND